ncbi:hypothetical protein AB0I55_29145 [Actinocatenispora sera]|uniref:hypothetical protein n=1 Tax=Actinocatenispora sera TaxID=390989 RepID=UPI0033F049DA
MLSNLIPSLIRTYVPLVVSGLVAWLTSLGVPLTDKQSAALVVLVGIAAGAVWYGVVRVLEHRWPALGALLGSPTRPTYDLDAKQTAPGRYDASPHG